jgi:hypothetical protein
MAHALIVQFVGRSERSDLRRMCGLFDLDFATEPGVARRQLTFVAMPKKVSKERRPA